MRPLILAFCLLFATACDEKGPVGPTVPLNQRFTLAPGQTATVDDTSLRLEFVGVSNDSRCPADAICVWAGDAVVQIRASGGGTPAEYELHTGGLSGPAVVLHEQLRIELLELQPYPFASRPHTHDAYRATLHVTRP